MFGLLDSHRLYIGNIVISKIVIAGCHYTRPEIEWLKQNYDQRNSYNMSLEPLVLNKVVTMSNSTRKLGTSNTLTKILINFLVQYHTTKAEL